MINDKNIYSIEVTIQSTSTILKIGAALNAVGSIQHSVIKNLKIDTETNLITCDIIPTDKLKFKQELKDLKGTFGIIKIVVETVDTDSEEFEETAVLSDTEDTKTQADSVVTYKGRKVSQLLNNVLGGLGGNTTNFLDSDSLNKHLTDDILNNKEFTKLLDKILDLEKEWKDTISSMTSNGREIRDDAKSILKSTYPEGKYFSDAETNTQSGKLTFQNLLDDMISLGRKYYLGSSIDKNQFLRAADSAWDINEDPAVNKSRNQSETNTQSHGMNAITMDNPIVQAFMKIYNPTKKILDKFIKQLEETAANLPKGGSGTNMFADTKTQSEVDSVKIFSKFVQVKK